MNIGENVRRAMEAAGINAQELSRRMRSQTQNVRGWMNGKSMSIDTLARFCQVTGCSADRLLGLDAGENRGTPGGEAEAVKEALPERAEQKEAGRFAGSVNLGDPEQLARKLRKDAELIRNNTDKGACHIWQAARHCEAAAELIERRVIGAGAQEGE